MADQPRDSMQTEIKVLQTNEATAATVLAGIVETQKSMALALESLRLSQYPPFSDVLKTAGVVIMIFASTLTALFWLVDSRITENSKLTEYRLAQIENHVEVSASWRNTTVVEKIPR